MLVKKPKSLVSPRATGNSALRRRFDMIFRTSTGAGNSSRNSQSFPFVSTQKTVSNRVLLLR